MLLNIYRMKKFIISTVVTLFVVASYAQVDRTKAPLPGPAPKITLGKYESFTLKNGLKVIVVENHKLPKVSYNLVIDADPTLEGNKAGYVSAFGEMLGRGTTNRTKAQIDEESDMIGASVFPNAGGIYGSVLKKNNEKLLDIMSDIILHPSFPKDEFDKVIKRSKDALESNRTDAGAIAGNLTARAVYGKNHPYGDIETDSTLSNITLQDLKDYYAKNFMPNISYLAIVGDITKAESQPLVEKYFGTWVKGTPTKIKLTNPTPPANPEITMSDRAGSKQSTLRFVYPVQNNVGGADYLKLRLLNNILGGGATGRLFMNLREKHGYTYGAYSSISADENVALFTASADVRTEVTDSAIYQFISEFNKIATGGVTADELQSAKNELTGSFAIGLEDPQTVARFAINIDMYKLPKDYYENYLTNLNAVTIEDVNAAAAKYVLPFNYHIVIVGDRAAIEKKIMKYDTDKKITFLDAFGYPAAELKSAGEGVTAQTVMDNFVKAIGGKDAIAKIKDATLTGKITSQFGVIEVLQVNKFPNKSFQLLTMGGSPLQKDIFDGTTGKTQGMQGDATLNDKEVKDAKVDASIAYEADFAALGMQANLLGIDIVEGKDAYKVEFTYPSGKKMFAWYSVNSSLKIKTVVISETEEGSMEVATGIGDYKPVSGVMFPHYIKTMFGDLVFEKIEVNTGVKDDYFSTK
jgi:predicted Zn-dependent peptidase